MTLTQADIDAIADAVVRKLTRQEQVTVKPGSLMDRINKAKNKLESKGAQK